MGLFGHTKRHSKREHGSSSRYSEKEEEEEEADEEIPRYALTTHRNARSSQQQRSRNSGRQDAVSGPLTFRTAAERERAVVSTIWSITQQAASGTPMEVKTTRKGVIIHKAMLCYINNENLAEQNRYYGEKSLASSGVSNHEQ